MAPALATGCTVVAKAASVAPLSTFLLADLVTDLDLPAGVFNLVSGPGAAVGEAMAAHPGVDLVSFTGSTGAGARVAAVGAPNVTRTTLELGGKSAFVVTPDADLDAALDAAVRMCFVNTGQTCAATTRLLVPDTQLAEVEDRVTAQVQAMQVGDPLDDDTNLGPLASSRQHATVTAYLRTAADHGTVLTGGPGPVEGVDPKGFYVRPTVVSRADPTSSLAREEIFGPVLAVMGTRDVGHAVALANDSEYGLSGAVWAEDVETASPKPHAYAPGRWPSTVDASTLGPRSADSGSPATAGNWGATDCLSTWR